MQRIDCSLGCVLAVAPVAGADTFTVLTYNVAGLPEGISSSHPPRTSPQISPLLNAYDLVAVQEDFAYDPLLRADLTFPYQSVKDDTPGEAGEQLGFAFGDGLNTFSKLPFTDFTRVTWDECYGLFTNASDCLTPKGLSFERHEFAPGRVPRRLQLARRRGRRRRRPGRAPLQRAPALRGDRRLLRRQRGDRARRHQQPLHARRRRDPRDARPRRRSPTRGSSSSRGGVLPAIGAALTGLRRSGRRELRARRQDHLPQLREPAAPGAGLRRAGELRGCVGRAALGSRPGLRALRLAGRAGAGERRAARRRARAAGAGAQARLIAATGAPTRSRRGARPVATSSSAAS